MNQLKEFCNNEFDFFTQEENEAVVYVGSGIDIRLAKGIRIVKSIKEINPDCDLLVIEKTDCQSRERAREGEELLIDKVGVLNLEEDLDIIKKLGSEEILKEKGKLYLSSIFNNYFF